MAASVVYSGVFGAVLASIPSVRTRMIVLDTAVVDLTEELTDPVELLVARLSLARGWKPREIQARFPNQFADINDVYRVKRTVLDRLRQSGRVTQILG